MRRAIRLPGRGIDPRQRLLAQADCYGGRTGGLKQRQHPFRIIILLYGNGCWRLHRVKYVRGRGGMRNVVALAALMAAVISFLWLAANSIPVIYKAPVLMP